MVEGYGENGEWSMVSVELDLITTQHIPLNIDH